MVSSNDQPALKRRKLDSALHRPFKSPLRTPLVPLQNGANRIMVPKSSKLAHSTSSHEIDHPRVPYPSGKIGKSVLPNSACDKKESKPTHTPNSARLKQPLQSTRSYEVALLAERRRNEHLRQALELMTSDPNQELRDLIGKWKEATRLAAEEVYKNMRERVHHMGGVKALRKQEKQHQDQRQHWTADDYGRGRAITLQRTKWLKNDVGFADDDVVGYVADGTRLHVSDALSVDEEADDDEDDEDDVGSVSTWVP